MDKLLVASEYTDPCFYTDRVSEKLIRLGHNGGVGLLLVSKEMAKCKPIVETAETLQIPTVLHLTITGMGGSECEPNVPEFEKVCSEIERSGILDMVCVEDVVLRIDPIDPAWPRLAEISKIISWAADQKISRCRVSVLDYYPFVRRKYADHCLRYFPKFQAPMSRILDSLNNVVGMALGVNMLVESCAEDVDISGLDKIGCAWYEEWKRYGCDMEKALPKRRNCFCDLKKYDLLAYEKECGHGCLYCYWGKNRE